MPPSSLATTLITYRKRRGLSQEELAATAKLSLRTVQRLENGQSVPRGFTLQALSEALDIPLDELTMVAETDLVEQIEPINERPEEPSEDTVSGYIALMYLSALVFLVAPGGNIVLPLFMRYYKRQSTAIYETGSQLLNFQLVWSIITYGGYLLLLFVQTTLLLNGDVTLIWTPHLYLWGLAALHVLLLLFGAWRARNGHYKPLPAIVRLF